MSISRAARRCYGVDVAVIDRMGAGAILAAVEHNPIVIIDEIGRMELFSSQFQSAVLKALGSAKLVLATAQRDDHPWVAALKALPQVTLWEVTKVNRNRLTGEIVAWLTRPVG